jgi:hypothetical protein
MEEALLHLEKSVLLNGTTRSGTCPVNDIPARGENSRAAQTFGSVEKERP